MSDTLEFDPFAEAIAELRAQIAKLQAAIDALESVRHLRGASSLSVRSSAENNFGHDAFFGMTGAEAAKKYLSAIKKTAPPKTIADALVAGGWKTSSRNVPENLRTILNRNPQFVVVNGEFGLAEWYPGRGGGRKARRTASDQAADTSIESAAQPDNYGESEDNGA